MRRRAVTKKAFIDRISAAIKYNYGGGMHNDSTCFAIIYVGYRGFEVDDILISANDLVTCMIKVEHTMSYLSKPVCIGARMDMCTIYKIRRGQPETAKRVFHGNERMLHNRILRELYGHNEPDMRFFKTREQFLEIANRAIAENCKEANLSVDDIPQYVAVIVDMEDRRKERVQCIRGNNTLYVRSSAKCKMQYDLIPFGRYAIYIDKGASMVVGPIETGDLSDIDEKQDLDVRKTKHAWMHALSTCKMYFPDSLITSLP